MALLRWLTHPLLWLMILLTVMVWLYRESLFPDFANSSEVKAISERIDQVIDTLAESSGPESSAPSDDVPVAANQAVATSPAAPADVPQAEGVMPPVSASLEITAIEPEAGDSGQDSVARSSAPLSKPQISQAPPADGVAAGDSPSVEQIWYQARAAMWQEDLDASVAYYQQLIGLDESNFDAHGELGNVYLLQGEVDKAVAAYSQAALTMSRAGYPQVAWNVLDIVGRLDPQQAESLYRTLREQQLSTARPR